jgi:hypothetical protein
MITLVGQDSEQKACLLDHYSESFLASSFSLTFFEKKVSKEAFWNGTAYRHSQLLKVFLLLLFHLLSSRRK